MDCACDYYDAMRVMISKALAKVRAGGAIFKTEPPMCMWYRAFFEFMDYQLGDGFSFEFEMAELHSSYSPSWFTLSEYEIRLYNSPVFEEKDGPEVWVIQTNWFKMMFMMFHDVLFLVRLFDYIDYCNCIVSSVCSSYANLNCEIRILNCEI